MNNTWSTTMANFKMPNSANQNQIVVRIWHHFKNTDRGLLHANEKIQEIMKQDQFKGAAMWRRYMNTFIYSVN